MGGLFGKREEPQTIVPKPAAPMPDTDSPASREARQKAAATALSRGGRASTILTAPEGRGGSDYSSTRLGTGA